MAARFWVGGTGTWNASATTNWSATTGGASGASAPTSADAVTFDVNSGTGTCTTASGAVALSTTVNSSTLALTFGAAFTQTGAFTLTLGAIDLVSYTLSCGAFSSSNPNVRSIAFGTGNITLPGTSTATIWTNANTTNFSRTGTPVVNVTGNAASGITRTILSGNSNTLISNLAISFVISGGQSGSTVALPQHMLDLTFTSTYFGTHSIANTNNFCYGNMTFGVNMGALPTNGNSLLFPGTTIFTTNGKTLNMQIIAYIAAATNTFTLADNFTSSTTLSINSGTFNTNNFNISCGDLSGGSTTKTLNFGTSTITITNGTTFSGFSLTSTGTTYNVGSCSIVFTASGINFAVFNGGSGATFPSVVMSGSGTLIIGGSATAQTITTLSNTVQPCTISLLGSAGTLTVTNFNLAGTAGNLVTFNSLTPGTARTISKATGTINAQYLSITDSIATGGATWKATNSTNGGNNTGWLFPTLYSDSITETLTSNDVPDATLSFITALTESLTSADSTTGGTAYVSSITENLVPTDSSSVIQIYNVSIEEAQSVADSYTPVLNYTSFIVEGLISGDSSVPNVAFISNIIENLASADTPTAIKVFNVSISEPQTIVDTATAIAGFISSSIENVISGESSIVSPVFYQTISETIAVQDSSIAVAAKIIAFVTEAIAMTDTQTAVVSFISSAEERIVTADSSIPSKAVFAVIVEPTTIDTAQQGFSWGKIDNTESTQWVLIDNRQ